MELPWKIRRPSARASLYLTEATLRDAAKVEEFADRGRDSIDDDFRLNPPYLSVEGLEVQVIRPTQEVSNLPRPSTPQADAKLLECVGVESGEATQDLGRNFNHRVQSSQFQSASLVGVARSTALMD